MGKENRWGKSILYSYSFEDKSTWAYLGCEVIGKGSEMKIEWIKNPDFKYSHLIKGY